MDSHTNPRGYICWFFCSNGGPGIGEAANENSAGMVLLRTKPTGRGRSWFCRCCSDHWGGGLPASMILLVFLRVISERSSSCAQGKDLTFLSPKHSRMLLLSHCPMDSRSSAAGVSEEVVPPVLGHSSLVLCMSPALQVLLFEPAG